MNRASLPLEILGLMSPLLSWIEGSHRSGTPNTWRNASSLHDQGEISWLSGESPTYSLDNLHEIVDLSRKTYSHGPQRVPTSVSRILHLHDDRDLNRCGPPLAYNLITIFSGLFKRYFQWSGNSLNIKEGRMVELHELMFRFPVGHVLRYGYAEAVSRGILEKENALKRTGRAYKLHTISRSLQTVIERGLCEGHLHLNGVAGAGDTWAEHLLRNMTDHELDYFSSENNRLLILGRLALRLLAFGLLALALPRCNIIFPFNVVRKLDELYHAYGKGAVRSARAGLTELLHKATDHLQKQMTSQYISLPLEHKWLIPIIFPGVQHLHEYQTELVKYGNRIHERKYRLHRIHFEVFLKLIEMNFERRHVDEWGQSINTAPEPYIGMEFIHQVFFRYLVYHGHFWQSVTQSGKTTGLQRFKEFYESENRRQERDARYRDTVVKRLTEAQLNTHIEGRLAPPKAGAATYRPWLRHFSQQSYRGRLEKVGLVIHFIKAEKPEVIPNKDTPPVRFHSTRLKTHRDAKRLFRLLSRPDPVTPFIVGIDAANLELTTPPEVYAPAFRFLREYPIEIQGEENHVLTGLSFFREVKEMTKNRRLNMTYHVGEDFRHLLSGLRAVDEVIQFLRPLPGDRLGHALALGVKPKVWLRQMGYQVVLPKIEWLDTLVWVHQFLGPGHPMVGALFLEDRIQRYAKEIFAPGGRLPGQPDYQLKRYGHKHLVESDLNPATLHDAWRLRQLDPFSIDFDKLDKFEGGTPLKSEPFIDFAKKRWRNVQEKVWREMHQYVGTTAAYRFLELYWYSGYVRKMGSEIISEDMFQEKDLWLSLLTDAQNKMQDEVCRRQIVIEANPSCNRLVGPISSYEEHPIFDLTLNQDGSLKRSLRVTVNTDNPGVFTTSLAHEYYLLGEVLLERGVAEVKVLDWLEWIRQNGHDASFLRDIPGFSDSRMKRMLEKFREYDYKRNRDHRYFWRHRGSTE